MRRVGRETSDERGAVAVLLALLLVALLGFAALAIDVGLLYSERAQLQNGADSAALAMAQTCAKDSGTPCSESSPLLLSLANKNALDNASNVKLATIDKANRRVDVTVGAQEVGRDPNEVTLFFAGALGLPTTTEVAATASVEWGSPTKGPVPFPMVVSICQVQSMVGGAIQVLQNHGQNANPDCPGTGPASGSIVPGGFGWIGSDPGGCGAVVDIALNKSGSDPGNNAPGGCAAQLNAWASDMTAGKQVVVLLPVYVAVSGTGSGATYDIDSFAALEVLGWKFSGNDSLPDSFRNGSPPQAAANECKGSCRGIIGRFIKYVSLADGYTLGPVSPHGATSVQLKY